MNNLDKLYNFVKGRGYKKEAEVRNYFKNRKADEKVISAIIKRLVRDGVIEEEKKESFFIPTYKKAVAFFFQAGRLPMSRQQMKMEMSFKLDWFRPDDADQFIGFCIRDGLLEERDGKVHPTFDTDEIDLPYEWSLHEELNIKTGSEMAKDKLKKKEDAKTKAYVRQEKTKESESLMEEEGMEIGGENEIDVSTLEISMTESGRDGFKRDMIKKLMGLGVPVKSANGLFDYYELNYGLADEEMFIMASVQFENYKDENILKKAFSMLEKEVWNA